ncbi:DUF2520 domain-containing protein [Algibacter amylolyticus]|uniref:DUF2520 domain-containing protein n=1 Tax=Algibacter amylolyticus TaxID=1608400 RepID=A0A5M7B1P7_9FLAO|nr:F420-dependent NADP oxidoreductase [Algibacter amylolyticus]KAA5823553.1 DUF2520 domain-containing protein [Algibacter amylolyticus]MBB5267707.1 putative short-subunit dehydrogenase-like oxidoreductase (DUF2520 family) [Algibacter amylolyticus]TSJ74041.1 DUF2520 domain-containing protein [Algibacter amylolyticus]
MISVVILGAGNVATHLFKGFEKTNDVSVVQWYNRNASSIQQYSHLIDVTDNLEALKDADLYIIAVSDDAISELSSSLPFKDKLVVHTSGSVSVYDLDMKLKRGVLYPLQSFSKAAKLDFANVPICIETIDKKSYPLLKKVAVSLGSPTKRINSDQRRVLHLAAVFVNNFTNQLYRIGHEITESEGAEFDLLKPLIKETANKIEDMSPFKAQTGPAKRNDKKTIKKHLKQLDNEHHKAVYELLTDSIKRTHGRKKL